MEKSQGTGEENQKKTGGGYFLQQLLHHLAQYFKIIHLQIYTHHKTLSGLRNVFAF